MRWRGEQFARDSLSRRNDMPFPIALPFFSLGLAGDASDTGEEPVRTTCVEVELHHCLGGKVWFVNGSERADVN